MPRAGAAALGRRSRGIGEDPFIWSCIIGIALNLLHVPIPPAVHRSPTPSAAPRCRSGFCLLEPDCGVVSLMKPSAATWISSALKLIVLPTVAVTLGIMFGATGVPLAVIACCAAVPTAFNAYVLARHDGWRHHAAG